MESSKSIDARTDVICWLKGYFSEPSIDLKEINPLLHFSLLWNLFEFTYFTEKRQFKAVEINEFAALAVAHIDETETSKYFIYFHNRYTTNNCINDTFKKLVLKGGYFDECVVILTKSNPCKQEKLKLLFHVIYRFRNNLFHGNKNPVTLNNYSKQFCVINNFLMYFINTTGRNNTVNVARFSNQM